MDIKNKTKAEVINYLEKFNISPKYLEWWSKLTRLKWQ